MGEGLVVGAYGLSNSDEGDGNGKQEPKLPQVAGRAANHGKTGESSESKYREIEEVGVEEASGRVTNCHQVGGEERCR